MPTYQYACTTCDHRLEAVQQFSDEPLVECPACEGGRLRKLFSAVGIVFKGSGFYRTDSRAGSTIPGKSESKVPASVGAKSGSGTSSESPTGSGSSSSATTSGTTTTTQKSTASAASSAN